MARLRFAAAALLLNIALLAGSGPASAATPGRTAAIATTPAAAGPRANDLIGAINEAYLLGSRGGAFAWNWSELEPLPGWYVLDTVVNQQNMPSLMLTDGRVFMANIQTINITQKQVPWDLGLTNVDWDSPQMISRFHALLDALVPRLGPRMQYLSLGNEVDAYLVFHSTEIPAFQRFYADAVRYIHSKWPQFKVGVTTTFNGASGFLGSDIATLNAPSDVLMLTYNQIPGWFVTYAQQARMPLTDFPKMLQIAGSKPVVLQEVAFPASTALGSSEQIQSDFVHTVFSAWNTAGNQIPFLNFLQLHDYLPSTCTSLSITYGLWWWADFNNYHCSVGFFQPDGTPKLAAQTFLTEAAALNAGTVSPAAPR